MLKKVKIKEYIYEELDIPVWCRRSKSNLKDHKSICCFCGSKSIKYQVGDGENLHSLCYDCYKDKKCRRDGRKVRE